MFKPLLRTLPSLSGNFTIACKVNEIQKEDNNTYSTYIRLANLIPLQNSLANKNIEVNLLNGKYEYDIMKYHYYYSDVFYKANFNYNKNSYAILNLNSLYNYVNDSRNKSYEFGCKRIQYSQHGSQFNFYAPIYVDNINDLPEYFCISIKLNDHLTKNIKIYINKNNKRNYLKTYLSRFVKQIDERVIYCLTESYQATYFGIDVKKGGIVQYKDNVIGNIYKNQTTIHNFDYTICKGFERNNLIMSQIIPLSFSFNLNDILSNYEKQFFKGYKLNISGFYCSKYNNKYDFYDFDVNYTHAYHKFRKFNKYTGTYELTNGSDANDDVIDIMNIGYPALNDSKYINYTYTNKVSPFYCKFKMLLSDDNDPYITNINYAYSYNQYPNQKYGYFPTMFKGIFPKAIISNSDLKLPIGYSKDNYYITRKYYGNRLISDSSNYDKYYKLMSNYFSSWYTINDYILDFNNDNTIHDLFNNSDNWSDVKYNYTYHNGILYNLKDAEKYKLDKFGVFLGVNLTYVNDNKLNNELIKAAKVISANDNNTYDYNQSYNMLSTIEIGGRNIVYYQKIFDMSNNSTVNVSVNQTMIKDIHGTYIEEKNYLEENTFYKTDDIISIINNYLNDQNLVNDINNMSRNGYLILYGYNNINFFYKDDNNNNVFLFDKNLYGTNEVNDNFYWMYNLLYYASIGTNMNKYPVSDIYNLLDYNEDTYGKFFIFIKTSFIHKSDLINILGGKYIDDNTKIIKVLSNLQLYPSYTYEVNGNINGVDLTDYFIRKTKNYCDIYVDTYNINNYIDLYNDKHNSNIKHYNINDTKNFYIQILNKEHLIEYTRKLHKNNTSIALNKSAMSNLLDSIYVKQRYWVIKQGKIDVKDNYISLYKFLINTFTKFNRNDIIDVINSIYLTNNNEIILNYLINYLSDTRSTNNNFVINVSNLSFEVDLCVNKNVILLDNNLLQLLNDKYFLYLYITDDCYLTNNSTQNYIQSSNLSGTFINVEDYLTPLFTSAYVNDTDISNIQEMLNKRKIQNNKYIIAYNKYFKEINVDDVFYNILYENQFALDFINNIKSLNILTDNELTNLSNKWDNWCQGKIYKENYIYFDNETNTYKFIDNNLHNEYLQIILDFINSDDIINSFNDLYYNLIYAYGITLYSISNPFNISYNSIIKNNNLIYDDILNMYIYEYNGVRYGFYWISFNFDNTNNSFNIYKDYNFNVKFDSIDQHSVINIDQSYIKKIFYLIEPFLKINLFNKFTNKINTISYPNELEININYISSAINDVEIINQNKMIKSNDDDKLYNIVKLNNTKKIKLLRYLNYITPFLHKTNIINDCWELNFIYNDDMYKNIKKYNVLHKSDINIYKYHGLNLYGNIYSPNHEYYKIDALGNMIMNYHTIEYQHEYKHFNDNVLYNLPELIEIKDNRKYSYNEILELQENKDLIEDKKIKILLKYFKQIGLDYENIILFLYNKYESNLIIDTQNIRILNNKKQYTISYKFILI